jgi:hypothetical protein
MLKPRIAEFFSSCANYWLEVERMRDAEGRLPSWCNDFVSVHGPVKGPCNLIAPLCWVDLKTGIRPDFEALRPGGKRAAVALAKELCQDGEGRVFVVYCADPANRETKS